MIVTAVFAIILLGLAGYQNDVGLCIISERWCAATGLGITAGVFGMLLGILGIVWLIISGMTFSRAGYDALISYFLQSFGTLVSFVLFSREA